MPTEDNKQLAKQILMDAIGIKKEISLDSFPLVDTETALEAIEYALSINKEPKTNVDICLEEGCNAIAQTNYRLCTIHLKEAHNEGFDDSNK